MGKGLFPYPLSAKTVHLCLDMQRIFAPGGSWATPWMERVLPVVTSIASRFPERTVFTRLSRLSRQLTGRACGSAIIPLDRHHARAH